MKSLLEKTRSINRRLQQYAGQPVNFYDIAAVLRDIIGANCYILSREGSVLGYALMEGFTCDIMEEIVYQLSRFPDEYNQELLSNNETRSNITQKENKCLFANRKCIFCNKLVTSVPIAGAGQRLGTLVLAKFNTKFTEADLVLAEYGATVIGMEILRSKAEKAEEKARKKAAVHIAISTLSYSELEAVEHIFDELKGSEGVLVASKIADRAGITRSVIVNALRKFESAGVIETKSVGMKGTYIKVLNNILIEELAKLKQKSN